MLVQKLDVNDLQFEKMTPFDGTMAYAQNKRQQVVMTTQYAKKYPDIHFSCMHPGWADTPGILKFSRLWHGQNCLIRMHASTISAVRQSMPDFYEKMKDRLRTADQGADTLVWLAISAAPLKHASGLFFQGMSSVCSLSLSVILSLFVASAPEWVHVSDTHESWLSDRQPVAVHLPLAWTKSKAVEEEKLMASLDELKDQLTKWSDFYLLY